MNGNYGYLENESGKKKKQYFVKIEKIRWNHKERF